MKKDRSFRPFIRIRTIIARLGRVFLLIIYINIYIFRELKGTKIKNDKKDVFFSFSDGSERLV